MAVVTTIPAQLASAVTSALARLRQARADGPPDHDSLRCRGACYICASNRSLDRLLDKVPRS